jgi:hypothetical protein
MNISFVGVLIFVVSQDIQKRLDNFVSSVTAIVDDSMNMDKVTQTLSLCCAVVLLAALGLQGTGCKIQPRTESLRAAIQA